MAEQHVFSRVIDRPLSKVPPQNIEIEQSILGSILLDNEALPMVIEVISSPDDFYKPLHRIIFSAMLSLYERNEPVDLMTLSEELKKETPGGNGNLDYLAELIDTSPTAGNVKVHARIVREKSILRRLITTAGEAVSLAHDNAEDVDDVLDRVEQMIMEISQDRATKTLVPIKTVLKEAYKGIENAFESKKMITGAPTGYTDLDNMTAGMHPSDLIIVAGRPSMGKTSLAMNIAQNLTQLEPERVVAVFSLEMSSEQLVLRMLCSEAKLSSQRLRTGFFPPSAWPKLTTAAGRLHTCNIFIDDTPAAGALDIRSKSRRLKSEVGRLDMIIVDYLQLMTGRVKTESRVQEISEITRSLKQLAKELEVPVVALSQLSRKVEERPDKRPQLSDLRESGSIEQDADLVMFVYREEFYKREKTPPELQGVAEIIIGKQRNGPTGTCRLTFIGSSTRFENLTSIEDPGESSYEEPL